MGLYVKCFETFSTKKETQQRQTASPEKASIQRYLFFLGLLQSSLPLQAESHEWGKYNRD